MSLEINEVTPEEEAKVLDMIQQIAGDDGAVTLKELAAVLSSFDTRRLERIVHKLHKRHELGRRKVNNRGPGRPPYAYFTKES